MDELSEAFPQQDLTFHSIVKLTQPPLFYYQPINQAINQPLKFYIMRGIMRVGFLVNNYEVFKLIKLILKIHYKVVN